MKFSEIPYVRPDIDEIKTKSAELTDKITNADCAAQQIAAYDEADKIFNTFNTMSSVCYIRHTVNTNDKFYEGENEFFDESSPIISECSQNISKAILQSKFRAELEEHYGRLLFTKIEIAVRSFSPEIIELMQEENKTASQYQKLYASAMVEWDGKKIPLPMLGPYKESPDRSVRKKAAQVTAEFFDAHREELDGLYDRLIKLRNAQARKLGYKNYIQLGYDRLGRNCYGQEEIKAFREQIARDLVPVVCKIKENQRRRIGVDKITIYDDTFSFPDGNAKPEGTSDEILAAGREMYHALSPETSEFIDFMFDNELFDVLSKEGKAPGGYCTEIPDYKAPFIFSNFNGTSGDVDVLTHEAGHAFAAYRAFKQGYISDYISPTIEACEVHSMSMEFLTEDYHDKFFGANTHKYSLAHCEDAINFIPYGCMVDEFQHMMYENEDLTPGQRNEIWLELEKKYRPYLDFDNLPFYSRGATWQRQLHIYLYPLYYIDYCMAQTVAFQFWIASMHDKSDAWARYLKFVDMAGTKPFDELVRAAGLKVPYEQGCIKAVADEISDWIDRADKKIR